MPSIKNGRLIWIAILVTIILVCVVFTPFRIQNAQRGPPFSLITAHKVGVLNEKRCNKSEGFSGIDDAQNPFDKVDIIYYINLDHRTDRNGEILGEFDRMGIPKEKIVRISAIKDAKYGDLGCSKSHIKTLEKFIESGKSNCIIFEDDFEFSQSKETVHKSLNDLFDQKVKYDVCMLSANTMEKKDSEYPFLKKVINSQTASGYMVNRAFADKLLQNYKEGAQILETKKDKSDPNRGNYCVDQYWKQLMPESQWYEFSPRLGKQRKSHSDIQGGVVEYGV